MSQPGEATRHDPSSWRTRFADAAGRGHGQRLRELRLEVYSGTVQVVRERRYELEGRTIELDRDGAFERLQARTVFYPGTELIPVHGRYRGLYKTRVTVHAADFLEVARAVASDGETPAVLNMASRQTPGGGVLDGAGAQEENLFRRSNLLCSLYAFAPWHDEYGVPARPERYPIPRESGGIWSPGVVAFRSTESTGYAFLRRPFAVDVISVPALNRPELFVRDGIPWLPAVLAEATRVKIRAILRIAAYHRSTILVLSAFGCGAFRNPPQHVARLFAEVLGEVEFAGVFKRVAFAVLDDHNAIRPGSPEGNYLPFERELAGWEPSP